MINKYPYTDYSQLNLDWILEQIDNMNANLDGIEERATAAAIEGAKAYVDENLASVLEDFDDLRLTVSNLEEEVDDKIEQLGDQYTAFIDTVNDQIALLENRINLFDGKIDASIIGVNARTDEAIAQNNVYIQQLIDEGYSELKVLNYFTGNYVTIQEMLDYLSSLHVNDGINYTTLATRAKTYTELSNLSITYTDLVLHGNTYIV